MNLFKKFFKQARPEHKKIGILYICTGKYSRFWDGFYKTCEKHFCTNSEKYYFVFSDQVIATFGNEKVTVIHQPKLGWPYDTLKRFHVFLEQRTQLEQMDFLFFFNANMLFVKPIKEKEILPGTTGQPSNFVTVIHPCFYDKKPHEFIYERSSASQAFVDIGAGRNYYQGCLSGGKAKDYLDLCEVLKKNIDQDEERGVMAIWHDESHINNYFVRHPPMELHPGYAYPESMKNLPFKKKILQLDKSKMGGHAFLRS